MQNLPNHTDIETSLRTTRVDYEAMRSLAFSCLGEFTLPWALKFALQGIKLKAGDFVSYKGKKHTDVDFVAAISDQTKNPGYVKKGSMGIGKESDKKVLSIKRLVRCMAANISAVISKGYGEGSDMIKVGVAAGLKKEFSFIDSVYGMDDDTVAANANEYLAFVMMFDQIIADAHADGYCEGSSKQSHYEAATRYITYRGFDVSSVAKPTKPMPPVRKV